MSFKTSSGKVIKDQEKLSFDFVPKDLPSRDEQLQQLFGLFRGVVDSNVNQNALLHGPVGTGKTVTSKRFCLDFEGWAKEKDETIDYVFVNCRRRKKNSSAMWKIVHHFDKSFPDRGFSVDEMMEVVKDKIDEKRSHLIVVLDEVDYLIQNDGSDLIYLLSRFDEEGLFPVSSISLMLVSQKNAFQLLEESARSSFKRSNRVRFPKYSDEELHPIIDDRVEMALHPGSISEDNIRLLAEIAGKTGAGGGDARFGIELLEKSALVAEMDGRNEIYAEDIRSAKGEVGSYLTETELKKLNEQEKLILLAAARDLDKKPYTTTGDIKELYKIICEEYEAKKLSHTRFWENLNSLSDEGFLNTKIHSEGEGRTTRVSLLDITAEKLEKKLEGMMDGKSR